MSLPYAWDRMARPSHATQRRTSKVSAFCRIVFTMKTLTIRTDPEVERALEILTREGLSRSEATRAAILAAEREHRRAQLRAEAEALRNDPEDVAAARALAAEMDDLRAW